MTCLLTDIPFDVKLHLLSYCDAITVLVRISSLSRSLRAICLKNDDIWKEHCHHVGFTFLIYSSWAFPTSYLRKCLGSVTINMLFFTCYAVLRSCNAFNTL